MPTVPDYPQEDWMSQLGKVTGSRKRFNDRNKQPPPMDIIRAGGQARGGREDYSRWEKLPKSTNIEDVRGQVPPTRERGEILAHWDGQERYTYQHHYANLLQGGVKQADGGTSTYRAIGVQIGDKHYMLPTIWDNKQVSNKEAVKRSKEIGLDFFPSGDNRGKAEAEYEKIHKYMEEDLTLPGLTLGVQK